METLNHKVILRFIVVFLFSTCITLLYGQNWKLSTSFSLGSQNGLSTNTSLDNLPDLLGDEFQSEYPNDASMKLNTFSSDKIGRTRLYQIQLTKNNFALSFSSKSLLAKKTYSGDQGIYISGEVISNEENELKLYYQFKPDLWIGVSYSRYDHRLNKYLHSVNNIYGMGVDYQKLFAVTSFVSIVGRIGMSVYPYVYSSYVIDKSPFSSDIHVEKQGAGYSIEPTIKFDIKNIPISPVISYTSKHMISNDANYDENTQILIIGLMLDFDLQLEK